MLQTEHSLAALIGSRICHDLISPIGAICNGIELLSLDGGKVSPELALISQSVDNANARIRFLRVAYGLAASGQQMGRSEITSILAGLAENSRLCVTWASAGDHSRLRVQEAFLALQCLESAMPLGGEVTVSDGPDGWIISGPADPTRPDPALWQALGDPARPAQVDPAQVQFALLPALLTERGRRVSVETGAGAITLRL